ncbi:hypothetical protein MP228_003978 [Amoeboaphelidium protococcarum]|nr:hypothetical protein MP228_003978 [Amoeboaphelidium protococcarum]
MAGMSIFDFLSNIFGFSILISGVYYGVYMPVGENQTGIDRCGQQNYCAEDKEDVHRKVVSTSQCCTQTEVVVDSVSSETQTLNVGLSTIGTQTDAALSNQEDSCTQNTLASNDSNNMHADKQSCAPAPPPKAPPMPPLLLNMNALKPKYKLCPIPLVKPSSSLSLNSIDLPQSAIEQLDQNFALKSQLSPLLSAQSLDSTLTADSAFGSERRDSGFEDSADGHSPLILPRKSIINGRRSHTIDLTLRQLRLSPSLIRDAVSNLDCSKIDQRSASLLLKYMPTDLEFKQLQNVGVDGLNVPEQFLYFAIHTGQFKERLEAIKFIHSYQEVSAECFTQLDDVQTAIDVIQSLQMELDLIVSAASKLTLKMNDGRVASLVATDSIVRLTDVHKLKEIRANNKRLSLFDILIVVVKQVNPLAMDKVKQLDVLLKCQGIKNLKFSSQVEQLQDGIDSLKFVSDNLNDQAVNDLVQSHIKNANDNLQSLISRKQAVQSDLLSLMKRYCGEDLTEYENNIGEFMKAVSLLRS